MTTKLGQQDRRKSRPPGRMTLAATRLVLFWEQLWPAVLPALAPPFLLVILSLFDAWRLTPVWLHWFGLVLGAAGAIYLLWTGTRDCRWPSRRDAQERLEEDGHVKHAPLQALDDRAFGGESGAALWRMHQAQSKRAASRARFRGAKSRVDERDPYALRFAAIGLFVVAMVAAGDQWRLRLVTMTAPGTAVATQTVVVDVWIEPPAYTGRAPIYMARAGALEEGVAAQVDAPRGSALVAQLNNTGRAAFQFSTEADETSIPFDKNRNASRAEFILEESGLATLRVGGKQLRWPIGVVGDETPNAWFLASPTTTEQNELAISFAFDDDYGAASAVLEFRLDPEQTRPLDAPDFDAAALGDRREVALEGVAGQPGERTLMLDLTADPWAGLTVIGAVKVTDGAGQTGATEELSFALPKRQFFNPLARAVVEQRQTLSVAAESWRRSGRSLDALTYAPEFFYDDMTDYLLLRTAFWRVMRQYRDGFDDAVEKFWPLALQLEDEALELARQRLEAAQEALRQALENGASEKEIARLVEELRAAMDDYLTALAQSGEALPADESGNARELGQSDLDEMLDSIRDLSAQGAQGAARQMLSDLEDMLRNLRMTQGRGGQGQGADGEGQGGAAGRAGELIGRQRELADETFKRGGQPGESGDDLAADENTLGGDLDQLMEDLAQSGANSDPNGEAARALGQARDQMRSAEQALRNGDFEGAGGLMERAIEKLRAGAEALAREQMRQAAERGEGGEGRQTDPLGRPFGGAPGDGVEVPGEGEAGRARAVIEELRRRLGEQGRSEDEIDYLERLLERF